MDQTAKAFLKLQTSDKKKGKMPMQTKTAYRGLRGGTVADASWVAGTKRGLGLR